MKAGISLLSFAVQTAKKAFSFNLNLQVSSGVVGSEAEAAETEAEESDLTSTVIGFRKE